MGKTKTNVIIGGREFSISGNESEESIQQAALYVEQKYSELVAAHNGVSSHMLMTLAAMNIADELLKLQSKMTKTKKDYLLLQEQIEILKQENKMIVRERPQKREPRKYDSDEVQQETLI